MGSNAVEVEIRVVAAGLSQVLGSGSLHPPLRTEGMAEFLSFLVVKRSTLPDTPELGPPQSPCMLARPSLAKMLNSLGYLIFGLRRCAIIMESSDIC
jgi:hypothetical protein